MKYNLPKFRIASMEPPQDRLRSKIGGVPWGFPTEKWPACCGHRQKLLAQFGQEMPYLDLGAEGNVLFLFQCLECGGIGDARNAGSGFILSKNEIGAGPTTVQGFDDKPELGEPLIGELWIEGWTEQDDGIPEKRLPEFFEWSTWSALHDEFPEIKWFDGFSNTRFGGAPQWTGNGPHGAYGPPLEFLFQLGSIHFKEDAPLADAVGCPINTSGFKDGRAYHHSTEQPQDDKRKLNSPWYLARTIGHKGFFAEYTNFGSDGTAYVFVNRRKCPFEISWYWSR